MSVKMTHLDKALMIANGVNTDEMTNEWRMDFLAEGVLEDAEEMISNLDNISLDDVVAVAMKTLDDGMKSAVNACNKALKKRTDDVAERAIELTREAASKHYEKVLKDFVHAGTDSGYIDGEFVIQYFESLKSEPDLKKAVLTLVANNDKPA